MNWMRESGGNRLASSVFSAATIEAGGSTDSATRWRSEMSPASLILLGEVRPVRPEAAGSSPVARAIISTA